ncbi:MAG TPA: sugar ABC transporter permease [Vicinamibacterales bacterium]|nr:sugar ABC transporter permease [Vicinamibacterales bacterium]
MTRRRTIAAGALPRRHEARLGWMMALPALSVIALIALGPVLWAVWESLYLHDLRMPWLGRRFIGLQNYVEAFSDPRFWGAIGHTVAFAAVSVTSELVLGLALAAAVDSMMRGRGVVRTAMLLPWAVPTVVVGLVWRFLFETPGGLMNTMLVRSGATPPIWFADPLAAWVPVVLADVWKTTPFVALLLLAGLQNIDRTLYEAARIDGASAWRQFTAITLPLLKPALLVALVFRTVDAFRVFDVIFVMTSGGPGTATETIAMYTFSALLENLRFGYGSALSVIIFTVTFVLALFAIRLMGRRALVEPSS